MLSLFRDTVRRRGDGGAAAARDAFRFFVRQASPSCRLPGSGSLFSVLIVDVAVLFAALFVLKGSIERKAGAVAAAGASPPALAAVASPVKEPLLRETLLIDDFSRGGVNALGGAAGGYGGYGGDCRVTGGGGVLKTAYDVSSPASYAGYRTFLGTRDLSAYRYLSFRVRGEAGGEVFRVELRKNGAAHRVSVSQIMPANLSRSWQAVTVPLALFLPDREREAGEYAIALLFEHSQGMPYTGAVYLKELQLY